MKRRFLTLLAATAVFAMIGVAGALAVGVPEFDNANATFQLKPVATPVVTSCAGEDATTYKKVTANWKGGEVDFTPGSTDYVLTGKLSFQGGVWTINTATGRGLFTAKAKLRATRAFRCTRERSPWSRRISPVHRPPKLADGSSPRPTAATPEPPGVLDGGRVLANVEASILLNGSFGISGRFGDAPPQQNTPDFSVTTINQTC